MKKNDPLFLLTGCLALFAPAVYASTILTFATTGSTGVGVTSGGPILDHNPNSGTIILRSGGVNQTAYGSNVTASSANNGAYLVDGDATPDIGLAWSVSGMRLEGFRDLSGGWVNAGNGILQMDQMHNADSFSVAFSPTVDTAVMLESLVFTRSGANLNANRGFGYSITVAGNQGTSWSSHFALRSDAASRQNFSFGDLDGKLGEILTLTITRLGSTDENNLLAATFGAGVTGDTSSADAGIDNLRFSQVPEPSAVVSSLGALFVFALLRRR